MTSILTMQDTFRKMTPQLSYKAENTSSAAVLRFDIGLRRALEPNMVTVRLFI
jgi:hypothetical protein